MLNILFDYSFFPEHCVELFIKKSVLRLRLNQWRYEEDCNIFKVSLPLQIVKVMIILKTNSDYLLIFSSDSCQTYNESCFRGNLQTLSKGM